ncbi:MAG: DUF4062 domain-containing protein [Burkholderiales bacterium]
MAKIYLSSTYQDLKEYREEIYKALRQLQHDVIGMEDYLAEGSRPLAKCLSDVVACDLYIGVFAFRYGYVPDEPANPDKLSITECEYRQAVATSKECLIFLVDENADWPVKQTDHHTGENDRGARIDAFKAALSKAHTLSPFKSKLELKGLVGNAVSLWEKRNTPKTEAAPERPMGSPLTREVRFGALLTFSEAQDATAATALGENLQRRGLGVLQSPRALFARTEAEYQDLEDQAVACHAAVVWLTPAFVDQLRPRAAEVARTFELLEARTHCLIAVCAGVAADALPPGWRFTVALDGAMPEIHDQVHATIRERCPALGMRTVGLPCVVIAMTAAEAAELFEHPEILQQEMPPASYEQFVKLSEAVAGKGAPVSDSQSRYGPTQRDWKPFGRATVEAIAGDIARRLNNQAEPGARQRAIKLQYYPFDGWRRPEMCLRPVYKAIATNGCLAIIDEMSLFHRELRKSTAAFVGSGQVAVVTISPLDASGLAVNQVLENETRQQLAGAFERYEMEFDPSCEFGVGEERRLKRWLHASLPDALDNLRAPPPDRSKLQSFRDKVGADRKRGIDDAIYAGTRSG